MVIILTCMTLFLGGIEAELAKTTKIKIGYSIGSKRKYLIIDDKNQVCGIVSKFKVDKVEKVANFLAPMSTVEFMLPDKSVKGFFVEADQVELERDYQGLYHLKSKSFCHEINKILSRAEGREIDILRDNP